MSAITVTPLSAEQIDTAYPLVREVAPGLGPAGWRRYARRAIGTAQAGHSGIMVARRSGRPFPCGLFCYHKEQDLARGPVLMASHFIAIDILDPGPVLAALVRELEILAPRLGCAAMRVSVNEDRSELALALFRAGHRQESHTLAKPAPGHGHEGDAAMTPCGRGGETQQARPGGAAPWTPAKG